MSVPLKRVASIRVSNVDKKAVEGDVPVRLCNYTDVYYRDVIRPDQQFMEATATREQVQAFQLRAGDVVITKDSETAEDIGVPAYVEMGDRELVCGYHLAIVRPAPSVLDGRFLFWSMASTAVREQLTVAATGVTRFGLRTDSISGTTIPCPELSRQRAIADFLDAATARIDALIAKKHRLLGVLEERLLAILEDLIKPPLVPLRRFAVVQGGVTVDAGRAGLAGVARPYLRVANVQDGRLDLSEIAEIRVPPQVAARSTLQPGDVVMTEANGNPANIGRGAVWRGEIAGCLHQNHIFAIRVDQDRLLPEFLAFITQSRYGRQYFRMVATQVGIATISKQKLLDFPIPALSVDEQSVLVQRVSSELRRLSGLFGRLNDQVALLREHRQALITAAVSGELKVA